MENPVSEQIPPRPDTSELRPDDLLTRAEVAGFFRVKPRTIREWTDDRLLPKVKVRSGVRYRWSDVQALADNVTAE